MSDEVHMARAMKVCSCIRCPAHEGSCPEIVPNGRCDPCQAQADRQRGTASQRGYSGRGHDTFRNGVLRRDPLCVCTEQSHGHGPRCFTPSTDADHHPMDRAELIRKGLNPNDPKHGRGLCGPCHKRETAANQPGGWNRR